MLDEQALQRLDNQTFEKVFRMYFPGLRAYARKILNDPTQAEEVVQEVFMQLWEKRGEITFETSIKSYLFRAVYNRSLNRIRDLKTRQRHQEVVESSNKENELIEFDPAVASDVKQHIYEAIGQLPEQCGRIFKMSRFEGLTYKEIAQKLNISPKTVEVQMGRALKKLREMLRHHLISILAGFFLWWL
ncbi:MAG: RNA polymerase sigma-70 factor [Bacteroidota bacterium]